MPSGNSLQGRTILIVQRAVANGASPHVNHSSQRALQLVLVQASE